MSEEVQENRVFTTEQIFDMLPYAVEIYDKLEFDAYRKKLNDEYQAKKKSGKDPDVVDSAIDAVKYILKNSGKIKNEFFEMVAIADNKSLEEVKKQSYFKTMRTIMQIFGEKEIVAFFKQAMQ